MTAKQIEKAAKKLTTDVCKILGAKPTHGQFNKAMAAIQAQLTAANEDQNRTVRIAV